MKMKCWPLVVLLAMMAWACSDDDADVTTDNPENPEVHEEPEGKKLVFAITGNAISPASSYWLLVSDKDGEVLDAAQLKNNESHTFEAAEGFAEETVTLTLIRNQTSTYTSIDTYANVPFGEYGIAAAAGVSVGKVNVNLEGYAGQQYYTIPSGPAIRNPVLDSFSKVDDVTKIAFTTVAQKSKVLITNNEAPFEYVYGDFEQNTEYTIPAGDLAYAETQDLPWPDDAKLAGWQITGINSEGSFLYFRMNRERSLSEPEEFGTIPVIPDFFTSYSVVQSATTDNVSNNYFYKSNTLAATMKYVEATLLYAQNGNTFTWETTGTSDAVWIQVAARLDGAQANWTIHGPTGEQSVVVPVIPTTVTGTAPNMKLSFAEFAENARSYTTSLREYPEHTGYVDVDVKPNLVPGTSLTWTEFLTKSEQLIPQ
jgi:hypothetical protein